MDYLKEIDTADALTYQGICGQLKQDIQTQAEETTEQAPPIIRSAVEDACKELYTKMDEFQQAEQETVPAPNVWKTFVAGEKAAMDKAFSALGELVGKTAQNAKETLEKKTEKVFTRTEDLLHTIQESTNFMVEQQTKLRAEELELKKNMEAIQSSILNLQELMDQSNITKETKEELAKMQKNGLDMLNHFNKIYDSVHKSNKKSVPYQTAKLYDVVKGSLKNVKKDLEICVLMKKAAMKEKATESYAFIAHTAGKIMKKGNGYMEAMEKAATKIYAKGKDLGNKIMHLKCFFGVMDDRDMMQKYMIQGLKEKRRNSDSLAQCIVKEMVKDGMDVTSIKNAFELMNKNVNTAVKSKEIKDMAAQQQPVTEK